VPALDGDRVNLVRGEDLDRCPLRLRVLDLAGGVLGHVAALDRVVQDLAEGLDREPARARRKALRPGLQLGDGQAVDPLVAELGGHVLEVGRQRGDASGLAVVLLEELVHELSAQAERVEALTAELERLRAEAERKQQAIAAIVSAAGELS
jgi:hypothetical protein